MEGGIVIFKNFKRGVEKSQKRGMPRRGDGFKRGDCKIYSNFSEIFKIFAFGGLKI